MLMIQSCCIKFRKLKFIPTKPHLIQYIYLNIQTSRYRERARDQAVRSTVTVGSFETLVCLSVPQSNYTLIYLFDYAVPSYLPYIQYNIIQKIYTICTPERTICQYKLGSLQSIDKKEDTSSEHMVNINPYFLVNPIFLS